MLKKFIDTVDINDWEIHTDDGWKDIKRIGKTIPYKIYEIHTINHSLKCADNHIVFRDNFSEVYVKDLKLGDLILTNDGAEEIKSVIIYDDYINMYDIEVDSDEHRYYTSGILSHNSIWLSNLAINGVRNGYNVALITLEMSDKKFLKRVGSNLLNVTMDSYNEWSKDVLQIKKAIKKIKKQDELTLKLPGHLYIKEYPTSAAGVPEIESYLKKMEEIKGIKFKLIVIDYINIMQNWRNPSSDNTYMKIKQIAEDVRAMAIRNNWTILSATQIGRDSFKSNDLHMEDISESVGLIATVDSLFGIIQDRMDAKNKEYQLKAIALRDAEGIGEIKRFKIDYNYMRIWEDFTDSTMDITNLMD